MGRIKNYTAKRATDKMLDFSKSKKKCGKCKGGKCGCKNPLRGGIKG